MPLALSRRDVLAGFAALAVPHPAGAATPARLVSMDYALAETAFMLGAPPFAVAGATDWPKWVVEPALPPGTVDVGDSQTANFELLAKLAPDFILTTPYLDPILPVLQRIGPTLRVSIYEDGAKILPCAVEAVRTLGAALDRQAAAEAFLAAADREFANLAERVRALPDRLPVLAISFLDPRHVRVYGGQGLYQGVLDRIGLANAFRGETLYWGFATIGVETLASLGEARVVIIDPVPPDVMPALARTPLWTELPFVKAGRVATMPASLMFGGVASGLRFARLLLATLEGRAA
ncbi:ABC transporter substrate-binding protein [Aureimonas endophytica]|uniref:ABC transporter substrate-binding protein n=1 Tax=Aureimonas endophytica TaxID=2027858 RepID=A0A916ZFW6_9HYPH|nr:ABC transporter substrate-binding protein [Aureimonas endophytica]GGD92908.1 ABC transporter substrate-binding protein [Aureimonas endophytica]